MGEGLSDAPLDAPEVNFSADVIEAPEANLEVVEPSEEYTPLSEAEAVAPVEDVPPVTDSETGVEVVEVAEPGLEVVDAPEEYIPFAETERNAEAVGGTSPEFIEAPDRGLEVVDAPEPYLPYETVEPEVATVSPEAPATGQVIGPEQAEILHSPEIILEREPGGAARPSHDKPPDAPPPDDSSNTQQWTDEDQALLGEVYRLRQEMDVELQEDVAAITERERPAYMGVEETPPGETTAATSDALQYQTGVQDESVVDEVSEQASLWDNPDYGREYEKLKEVNIGGNFPVIDDYRNGVATSLKTANLTDNYQGEQGAESLRNTLTGYVDKLAGFEGRSWGGVTVDGEEVEKLVLQVGVPPGANAEQQAAMKQVSEYAKGKTTNLGVPIEVVFEEVK